MGDVPVESSDGQSVRFREHPVKWLFQEPDFLRQRKDAAKAKKETEEQAAAEAKEKTATKIQDRLKIKVGRRDAEVSVPACGCCGPSKSDGAEKKSGGGDGLGAAVWKAIGATAAGITATGAVVAVGAAVTWIRFNAVGIPATQAVSVQPKGEPLVLGAQETIVFVAIALVVVLLVYFADPEGVVRRITLLVLTGLVVGAAAYIVCGTHLSSGWKLALIVLAVALLAGCVAVGHRSDTRFWPLALAVFTAALVFSAATGILIVKQQKFVQGIAILRGPSDVGLTGVYVAATDKTIYFAQKVATDADPKSRMAMLEVPREGATYAVGPLESRADAARREKLLLEQLIANRERNEVAPKEPKEPPTDIGAKGDEEAKEGKKESAETGASTGAPEKAAEAGETAKSEAKTVAEAFGAGAVEVHTTVEGPWDCLVRYAAAGSGLLGRWWTSCAMAEELERDGMSMFEIRDELALPSRFQLAYDMRVKAHLPLGAKVTFMTGPIAPQCEHAKPLPCGYMWKGSKAGSGVEQIFLPEPQLLEQPRRTCTETAIDETPKWNSCKPQP
jgi:hypothetical protein